MTEARPVAQRDLLCTACAGQCHFSPESGTLRCGSCGTDHTILVDENVDPAFEHHYDPDLPHTEQPRFTKDRRYQCVTCGGEVVFRAHSISEACPYCNGALVERPHGESYAPLGMIPFALGDSVANENAAAWVAARWAAPSDLNSVVARGRVAGIYVPFWTFDSKEDVRYTLSYRVRSGKRTSIRSMTGRMKTAFDDLLMPASPHVTPLIRDGILHDFDPGDLQPLEPAFMAGFAAELHHQSVREGLAHNASDKAVLLRQRVKRHSGKKNIVQVSYKTDTTGIRYRRIMLPVWILHYQYAGKPMKIVTCGLKGRTFGERPFSQRKLFELAAAISTLVALFGLYWGAMQIY